MSCLYGLKSCILLLNAIHKICLLNVIYKICSLEKKNKCKHLKLWRPNFFCLNPEVSLQILITLQRKRNIHLLTIWQACPGRRWSRHGPDAEFLWRWAGGYRSWTSPHTLLLQYPCPATHIYIIWTTIYTQAAKVSLSLSLFCVCQLLS